MLKRTRILVLAVMGALTASPVVGDEPTLQEIASALDTTMRAHHYKPAELEEAGYIELTQKAMELAHAAPSKEAFVEGYNALWNDGPFSHVQLSFARGSAADMAAFLDTMDAGGNGAKLSWQDNTAILTVNTMMGQDTIEQIDAAYAAIASRRADGLIIDLRNNEGGAFAIRPLIEHLIGTPFDAGGFVAQRWNRSHARPPQKDDLAKIDAWNGWSVRAFWDDAQTEPLIKVHLRPRTILFDGPVYVLTSSKTASAAEIATDALKGIGRATIVGEKTAGEMLSQKPYDIPGGLHLFLPIADYYSAYHGRIEGNGVEPDVKVPAAEAMDYALKAVQNHLRP